MNLAGLIPAVLADPALAEALDVASARGQVHVIAPAGVRPSAIAALAAGTSGHPGRPVVVVVATTRDADDLAAALRCYLPDDVVAVLPALETLPHERLSPRSDTVARRLAVLRRLAHPDPEQGPTG